MDNDDATDDPRNSGVNSGMEGVDGVSALLSQFIPNGPQGVAGMGGNNSEALLSVTRFLQQCMPAQHQRNEGFPESFSSTPSMQHLPLSPPMQATAPLLSPTFNPFLYAAYLQFQQMMASHGSSLQQQHHPSSQTIQQPSLPPLRAPPPTGLFTNPLALNLQKAALEMTSANLQLQSAPLNFPMLQLLTSPHSTPTPTISSSGEILFPCQTASTSSSSLLQIARLPADQLASIVGASFNASMPIATAAAPPHLTSPLSTDSETSNSTSVSTTALHAATSCTTASSPPSSTLPANSTMESSPHQMQLLPSNDKEGWCRNKKYIQVVKKGYKCLVCNKIYGRYNSVSYHVTIYHRNPPIKCEEEGCQFTTREARYIHFHKYYRHQIPLPGSIDLASRKCPLDGCKHVSKSPAMLDKHMHRHVTDSLKDGLYVCSDCHPTKQFPLHEELYCHLRDIHARQGVDASALMEANTRLEERALVGIKTEHDAKTERQFEQEKIRTTRTQSNDEDAAVSVVFPCGLCPYKSRTMESLEQHKLFKHSSLIFNLTAAGGRQSILHHNALTRRRTADCINTSSSSTGCGETIMSERINDESMEVSEAKPPSCGFDQH